MKGRKRHILTDKQGFLVAALVHAADIQDRDGVPAVLAEARYRFPWLRHIFADGGYAGEKLRSALCKMGTWTSKSSSCPTRPKASKSCPDDGLSSELSPSLVDHAVCKRLGAISRKRYRLALHR